MSNKKYGPIKSNLNENSESIRSVFTFIQLLKYFNFDLFKIKFQREIILPKFYNDKIPHIYVKSSITETFEFSVKKFFVYYTKSHEILRNFYRLKFYFQFFGNEIYILITFFTLLIFKRILFLLHQHFLKLFNRFIIV